MIRSAVTISLVPEVRGGPFVFWDDLSAGCGKAAALGFDAVEVFAPSAEALGQTSLKSLLVEHKLKLAALGTGAGWAIHRWHLSHSDPKVRQRAREFIGSFVDFAAGFGAPAIIGSMQGRSEGEVTREQALAWLGEALEELGARAERCGVPLLFEPLNRYETTLVNQVADGMQLLESLRTRNVKLLCDLFHMNIEEVSIPAALRQAAPRLGHIHFVDSNRRPAGLGHIDFPSVVLALREIGYAGYASAEALPYPDSGKAAQQTMAFFRKCFSFA